MGIDRVSKTSVTVYNREIEECIGWTSNETVETTNVGRQGCSIKDFWIWKLSSMLVEKEFEPVVTGAHKEIRRTRHHDARDTVSRMFRKL